MLGEGEGVEVAVVQKRCWSLERLLGHIAGRRGREGVRVMTVQRTFAQSGACRIRIES